MNRSDNSLPFVLETEFSPTFKTLKSYHLRPLYRYSFDVRRIDVLHLETYIKVTSYKEKDFHFRLPGTKVRVQFVSEVSQLTSHTNTHNIRRCRDVR